jgi:GNAT superfamily N-acetyltransferase
VIKLVTLNKSQLLALVNSREFLVEMAHIPISPVRALSHSVNPCVSEGDVLLVIAYLDTELVGYMGILPDTIKLDNAASQKIGWLSCLWVNPEKRGMGIGYKLLKQCMESWQYQLLLTEFTKEAGALYDKSKFFKNFHDLPGKRYYLKSDLATLMPPKHAVFGKLDWLLTATDAVANIGLKVASVFKRKRFNQGLYTVVTVLDEEVLALIKNTRNVNEVFARDEQALNWVFKNPWLTSAPKKDELNQRYFFSSVVRFFKFEMLKIYNPETRELVAFVLLSVRDRHLRTPYIYALEGHIKWVALGIEQYARSMPRVHTLTTYNASLIDYWNQHHSISWFSKPLLRRYILSTAVDVSGQPEVFIQDGDGDCAFT